MSRRRAKLIARVVYSTEVPGEVKLLPLAEEEYKKGSVKELGAFDDFRVRILPVLGTSTPLDMLIVRTTSCHLWLEHCDLYSS